MQRKIQMLYTAENAYKIAYNKVKALQADPNYQQEELQRRQKTFHEKEASLLEIINVYNYAVEEYMLTYSGLCETISEVETQRRNDLRDALTKYSVFEMNYIKNIEYGISKHSKSLEAMTDKMLVQDKASLSDFDEKLYRLAKISAKNYIEHLVKQDKIELHRSH